jgi:hypothetical protein
VSEFLRRAVRAVVRVGETSFLEAESGDPRSRVEPSALLGLALLSIGDHTDSFRLARGIVQLASNTAHWPEERRAFASALFARMHGMAGSLRGTIRVSIDGHPREVPLVHGVATIASRELSLPGRHAVVVDAEPGTALIASAESRYGRPWNAQPSARAPIAVTLDGAIGARDTRSALRMIVQNRGPRVIPRPVVEIDLPAGAELDEESRLELGRHASGQVRILGRTLIVPLRPLAPGGSLRMPVPLRWSVGGNLRGLGVAAYISADPGAAVSVLPSRSVTISDQGREPSRPPEPQSRTALLESRDRQ